jgi:mannose/fructose/N-acetylgalactosamine-specific phosphotransferase system component IID
LLADPRGGASAAGRGALMEQMLPIIIALVLIVLAWKFLKGTVKTVVLLAILILAGLYVFGGGA